MIKKLIKFKLLKFILIGGVSAAYAFKRYCKQKNEVKSKKDKKTKQTIWTKLIITDRKCEYLNFLSCFSSLYLLINGINK